MKNSKPGYYLASKADGFTEIVESMERPKMISEGGVYSIMSPRYESKQELYSQRNLHNVTCKECFGLIDLKYIESVSQKMIDHGVCHTCLYWTEIINDRKNPNRLFVKGLAYYFKPYRDIPSQEKHVLGFGGRIFYIQMSDGELKITNNLWCNGTIKDRFVDRLPDNALFLNKDEYDVLLQLV